jgi:hypothetical protein
MLELSAKTDKLVVKIGSDKITEILEKHVKGVQNNYIMSKI